tara:strand:+ start:882 stop:1763 length:882 start_codon:yes stop_codon:yes gene_type:complete
LGGTVVAKEKPTPTVSIYSRVAPTYERQLDENGKPERQFYAIAYGGRADGTLWNKDQEKEDFPEISGIIAEELAKENYHFAPDKESADLMVLIHWGLTNPYGETNFSDGVNVAGDAFRDLQAAQAMDSGGSGLISGQNQALQNANGALDSALAMLQMESSMQARQQEETARVIGYTDELARNNDIARFAGSGRFDTLIQEVQSPRYYVIVTAYDFQEITNNTKKRKPLPQWVTRFSIRSRGTNFMEQLDQMAFKAGSYFGRDSGRLIRDRRGEVEIGDLQVMETTAADSPIDN